MKLELVSHPLCPFVHRASIMLREKGVPFSTRYVDLKAKPDWFLAISPRGKVPVLVADGVALFESAPIVEFLDETHPPSIIPTDPYERARQRAWVEVANDLLAAQFKAVTAPTAPEHDAARATLAPIFARYEQELASFGEFGLVHIATAPALQRFAVVEARVGARFLDGKLRAWALPLATRPSVADTVPADFADRFIAMMRERNSVIAS